MTTTPRRMTCLRLLRDHMIDMERVGSPGDPWKERHRRAWQKGKTSPFASGPSGIVKGLVAVAHYADAHYERFGTSVGDDGVFGPPICNMLSSIRALLNGDTGGLDCGTVDGLILKLAAHIGLSEGDL